MSTATKVSALDHAMQSAHMWVRDVAREFNTVDREFAYRVLRAWLHTLRDRLTVEASAHFAAQLPDLIRGEHMRVAGGLGGLDQTLRGGHRFVSATGEP